MSMLMRTLKQADDSRAARQQAQERAATDAEVEQAARGRIGVNNNRLDELKANELAEAEALALARIRAQTERTLAAQAESLADAERKLELTAIERRSTDLEAVLAAGKREAADLAAREVATKHAEAERQAAAVAQDRAKAVTKATAAAEARRQAEIDKKSAVAVRRRAQWAAFWAGARFKPLALIGSIMLLLGLGGGLSLAGRLAGWAPAPVTGDMPETRLTIDANDEAFGLRVAALPPRYEPPAHRKRR